MIELAVITSDSASSSASEYQLTDFGKDVLTCSVDVHLGILETVCSRFDLRWHGRIAAAYVQTSTDIFLRSKVVNTCGLTPEQVASGRDAGFMAEWKVRSGKDSPKCNVLTGIAMYLTSVAKNSCLDPAMNFQRRLSNTWQCQ